ncbi:AfsR/SARP family transcriptional regulator [Streptomyces sp. NPDC006355]|uniref:AfsR/SARP family transcriptional regulator n=1 Tax=Streptomyces sp. NPDC006355 TaxID=3156758 RepID=UPI0033ABD84A
MDIGVLGALDVKVRGVSITPTAPKPRQILALLASRVDHLVPVEVLTEELWGSRPPRSARTTLQTYVLQLRELITAALASGTGPGGEQGLGAKDVLVTLPGGYRLAGSGGGCDAREFEMLAGRGYRAMDAGDFTQASALLRQALGLWSGDAFADVRMGTQLQGEAWRLDESRLCALEQCFDAELRLGRHRELLSELTVLVNRHCTHENLHAQFMLALYRSGRRGEALHVFQRLRSTLVRELGLEPSAPVRRLQRSILMAAPDAPAGAAVPSLTA